ncbi:AraC family transcriptional regulator [Roseburia sp. 499]|uniref:AraC family transcriptional regulator n=1 Tax=Roseburia sp. 499 TaxID=1261634 RepID=UPI0009525081|nr:AraC family transcriptional regulator [Roseburia sp. 499]WVK69100.1 AraC family transcriptional regulator [Roseburia sp. 499]
MNNTLLHETKIHGTIDFPYIVYHGKIPDFIHSYPLHWHDEAEIIYVTKGCAKITVWSNTYHVQEGDIVILMPHAIHSIEQLDSHHAEYFNIVFHFSILEKPEENSRYDKYLKPFLTHEKSVNCYEPKGTKLNTCLTPLLLSLIENRRNSYTTCEYLVKSNLFMIMHYLNQACINTDKNEVLLQENYHKLKTVLYHVQNSYAQNITIKQAAALCGFSESHFMKLFKELTGMSFTAYLVNYRLELSAKQLIETDQKIIDIATNCGFNNHSYFTRAFLRKYNLTPAKYRRTFTLS